MFKPSLMFKLFRRARTIDTERDWQLYEDGARLCKNDIKKAKQRYFNYDLSSILKANRKKFWQIVNPKEKTFFLTQKRDGALSAPESAMAHNARFGKVFTNELPLSEKHTVYTLANTETNDIIVSIDVVISLISRV